MYNTIIAAVESKSSVLLLWCTPYTLAFLRHPLLQGKCFIFFFTDCVYTYLEKLLLQTARTRLSPATYTPEYIYIKHLHDKTTQYRTLPNKQAAHREHVTHYYSSSNQKYTTPPPHPKPTPPPPPPENCLVFFLTPEICLPLPRSPSQTFRQQKRTTSPTMTPLLSAQRTPRPD